MSVQIRKALKAKQLLLQLVSAAMIREPAVAKTSDSFLLMQKCVGVIAQVDPEFILKMALYVRSDLGLRGSANTLTALASLNENCRPFLKAYISALCRLPTDWLQIANFAVDFGDGVSVPNALRKALVAAFCDFDEYELAKYNKESSSRKKAKRALEKKKQEEAAKKKKKSRAYDSDDSDDSTDSWDTSSDDDDDDDDDDDESSADGDDDTKKKHRKAFTIKSLIQYLHISQPRYFVMCILGLRYPANQKEFDKSGLAEKGKRTFDPARAGKRMRLKVPATWETQISEHGNLDWVWQKVLDDGMPFMAMLRNIRNMIIAGIDEVHHDKVIGRLENEDQIANSRQFPYRFFSAFESLKFDFKEIYWQRGEKEEFEKAKRMIAAFSAFKRGGGQKAIAARGTSRSTAALAARGRGGAVPPAARGGRGGGRTLVVAKKPAAPEPYPGGKAPPKKRDPPKAGLPSPKLIERYNDALNTAVKHATNNNIKPISGRTFVFVNIREHLLKKVGAGGGGVASARSYLDLALLLALMFRYGCEDATIAMCGPHLPPEKTSLMDSPFLPDLPRDGKLLENLNTLSAKLEKKMGTNRFSARRVFPYSMLQQVIDKAEPLDCVVVIDAQEDDFAPPDQKECPHKNIYEMLDKLRDRVNPNLLYVNVDICGQPKAPPVRADDDDDDDSDDDDDEKNDPKNNDLNVHLTGFSDSILRFVAERGESPLAYIERIDEIKKLDVVEARKRDEEAAALELSKIVQTALAPKFRLLDTLSQKRKDIAKDENVTDAEIAERQFRDASFIARTASAVGRPMLPVNGTKVPIKSSLRMFISSTFADMVNERKALVQDVFPLVRRSCLERGIALQLVEIDLRWGITDAQVKSNEALNLCLNEVARCAPLFVSLVGARRGHCPTSLTGCKPLTDDVPSNAFDWLSDHKPSSDLSMTRLEFLQAIQSRRHYSDKNYISEDKLPKLVVLLRDHASVVATVPSAHQGWFKAEASNNARGDGGAENAIDQFAQDIVNAGGEDDQVATVSYRAPFSKLATDGAGGSSGGATGGSSSFSTGFSSSSSSASSGFSSSMGVMGGAGAGGGGGGSSPTFGSSSSSFAHGTPTSFASVCPVELNMSHFKEVSATLILQSVFTAADLVDEEMDDSSDEDEDEHEDEAVPSTDDDDSDDAGLGFFDDVTISENDDDDSSEDDNDGDNDNKQDTLVIAEAKLQKLHSGQVAAVSVGREDIIADMLNRIVKKGGGGNSNSAASGDSSSSSPGAARQNKTKNNKNKDKNKRSRSASPHSPAAVVPSSFDFDDQQKQQQTGANHRTNVVLVTGTDGCGKSSLVHRSVWHLMSAIEMMSSKYYNIGGKDKNNSSNSSMSIKNAIIFVHDFSAGSGSVGACIIRLAKMLIARLSLEDIVTAPNTVAEACAALPTIYKLVGRRRHALYCFFANVDSCIDQEDLVHSIGTLIPPTPSPVLSFVVEAGQNSKITSALRVRAPPCHIITLGDLDRVERCELLHVHLQTLGKSLMESASQGKFVSPLLRKSESGKPTYLVAAISSLCLFATHDTLAQDIRSLASSTRAVQSDLLQRLENGLGKAIVQDVLSTVVLSRSVGGIAERDLYYSCSPPHSVTDVRRVLLAVQKALTWRNGVVEIHLHALTTAITKRYLERSQTVAERHSALANYYWNACPIDPTSASNNQNATPLLHLSAPRQVVAMLFHALGASNQKMIEKIITNVACLESAARGGLLSVLFNLVELLDLPKFRVLAKKVAPFTAFLRKHQHILLVYPKLTLQTACYDTHVAVRKAAKEAADRMAAAATASSTAVTNNKPWEREGFDDDDDDDLSDYGTDFQSAVDSVSVRLRDLSQISRAVWSNVAEHGEVDNTQTFVPSITHGLTCVAASEDGTIFALGCKDGTCYAYNVVDGTCKKYVTPCIVTAVLIQKQTFIVGGDDGVIRVFAKDGTQTHTASGHRRTITQIATSPDGRIFLSSSTDGTVKSWNPSSSGRSGSNSIRCWETRRGHHSPVTCVAIHQGGNFCVSGGWDGRICVWDHKNKDAKPTWVVIGGGGQSGDDSSTAAASSSSTATTTIKAIRGVAFAPTMVVNVIVVTYDGAMHIYDVAAGHISASFPLAHNGVPITRICTTTDGKKVLTADIAGNTKVWRSGVNGTLFSSVTGHKLPATGVAVAPTKDDGSHATVFATVSQDGSMRMWNIADIPGEPRVQASHAGAVTAITAGSSKVSGSLVYSASRDFTVCARQHTPDATSGQASLAVAFRVLANQNDSPVVGVLAENPKVLVTTHVDGSIRGWHNGPGLSGNDALFMWQAPKGTRFAPSVLCGNSEDDVFFSADAYSYVIGRISNGQVVSGGNLPQKNLGHRALTVGAGDRHVVALGTAQGAVYLQRYRAATDASVAFANLRVFSHNDSEDDVGTPVTAVAVREHRQSWENVSSSSSSARSASGAALVLAASRDGKIKFCSHSPQQSSSMSGAARSWRLSVLLGLDDSAKHQHHERRAPIYGTAVALASNCRFAIGCSNGAVLVGEYRVPGMSSSSSSSSSSVDLHVSDIVISGLFFATASVTALSFVAPVAEDADKINAGSGMTNNQHGGDSNNNNNNNNAVSAASANNKLGASPASQQQQQGTTSNKNKTPQQPEGLDICLGDALGNLYRLKWPDLVGSRFDPLAATSSSALVRGASAKSAQHADPSSGVIEVALEDEDIVCGLSDTKIKALLPSAAEQHQQDWTSNKIKQVLLSTDASVKQYGSDSSHQKQNRRSLKYDLAEWADGKKFACLRKLPPRGITPADRRALFAEQRVALQAALALCRDLPAAREAVRFHAQKSVELVGAHAASMYSAQSIP